MLWIAIYITGLFMQIQISKIRRDATIYQVKPYSGMDFFFDFFWPIMGLFGVIVLLVSIFNPKWRA